MKEVSFRIVPGTQWRSQNSQTKFMISMNTMLGAHFVLSHLILRTSLIKISTILLLF